MAESGNGPSDRSAHDLDVIVEVVGSRSERRWFARHENRCKPAARSVAKVFRDGSVYRGFIEAPRDHDDHVVGHVTLLVVGHQVFAGDSFEHIAVADDRLTHRMLVVNRVKELLPKTVFRVVETHVDLTENHSFFALHFSGGQRRVKDGVAQNIDGHGRVLRRNIDVIHRAVERGVSVDITAVSLNLSRYFAASAPLSSLEE